MYEDQQIRLPAAGAAEHAPAAQVWCHWHDGRTDTGLLILVEEQASGPGASLYACAACRKEHGLVPWQGWDG